MEKILGIYRTLYRSFGPQRWWPTTLEGELHPTYHGKEVGSRQIFEIIVGAILTQNTSWKNVEKAVFSLNKSKTLDISKIRKISKSRLAGLIKPSGYYNQKAERLKTVADFFWSNKNPSREELLAVNGIGPETADSILLYAFGKPVFVVDAYTKRIFSRMGLCKESCGYEELQEMFRKSLPADAKVFSEYHALIVELAKRNCTKKPQCNGCPAAGHCKKFI